MLKLGWLYSKACVEETPRPVMNCGRNYIIYYDDVNVILYVSKMLFFWIKCIKLKSQFFQKL